MPNQHLAKPSNPGQRLSLDSLSRHMLADDPRRIREQVVAIVYADGLEQSGPVSRSLE